MNVPVTPTVLSVSQAVVALELAATTQSKLGGTRIPMEKVDDLPPVKQHELVTLHRDGSVRYFTLFTMAPKDMLKDPDIVAVVYNDIQGPTLPEILVSDIFIFDSTFLKCIFTLRKLMDRYIKRSFYHISLYSNSDASTKSLGIYKTRIACELRLRSAL